MGLYLFGFMMGILVTAIDYPDSIILVIIGILAALVMKGD